MKELITTLVSTWKDPQRPYRAELRVDGHCVEKSYHSTRQSAFIWCQEAKERKQREMGRG